MEIYIYIFFEYTFFFCKNIGFSSNFRKDICEKFVATTTLKFVYMYKVAVSITYLLLIQSNEKVISSRIMRNLL